MKITLINCCYAAFKIYRIIKVQVFIIIIFLLILWEIERGLLKL